MNNIRCTRCGRLLKDPLSRALRMGPECRGDHRKQTKRQLRAQNRVLRGVAYSEKTIVKIGQTLTYTYKNGVWKSEKSQSTHEHFGAWLKQYGLITMPAEHLVNLKEHVIEAAQILKDSRKSLDKDQVKQIQSELNRLWADIRKFTKLSKRGGANVHTEQAQG